MSQNFSSAAVVIGALRVNINSCIKSLTHACNSHVSMNTNPCSNKAVHVLLLHGFGTLNILVLGH